MKIYLVELIRKFISIFNNEEGNLTPTYFEKILTLDSLGLATENRKKTEINSLCEVEFSGFSQWGEDGIIDWLVERLPNIPKIFIEFGVGDYKESNTRLLLYLRNWKGLVLDGSSGNIESIKSQDIYWRYNIVAEQAFITRDNINELIKGNGFNDEIGILSIDIDGNDYWVWDSIDVVKPYIVICEYNAVFGDLHSITVPYDKNFYRTDKHYSNLYFGASIKALINLAKGKGYSFVGTCSNGCNAFFICDEKASFLVDSIHHHTAYPSSVRESRNKDSILTFLSGTDRVKEILDMSVYDTEKDTVQALSDYYELYSMDWRSK